MSGNGRGRAGARHSPGQLRGRVWERTTSAGLRPSPPTHCSPAASEAVIGRTLRSTEPTASITPGSAGLGTNPWSTSAGQPAGSFGPQDCLHLSRAVLLHLSGVSSIITRRKPWNQRHASSSRTRLHLRWRSHACSHARLQRQLGGGGRRQVGVAPVIMDMTSGVFRLALACRAASRAPSRPMLGAGAGSGGSVAVIADTTVTARSVPARRGA